MFPKGLSPVPVSKESPDDVPASPSSQTPAGEGQEMLARVASVVSSLLLAVSMLQCGAQSSTKLTAFQTPVFLMLL